MAYRLKSGEQVIYGTGFQINAKYPIGVILFVLEMNNEENRIEGIGLISNNLVFDKKHKIYDDTNYNRFIYRGDHWLSREKIIAIDPEIVTIFDKILFKGKSHLKRQSGITIVTKKLASKWEYDLEILKKQIKNIFIDIFKISEEKMISPDYVRHGLEDKRMLATQDWQEYEYCEYKKQIKQNI
jgi:hypothetical protein